MNYTIGDDYSYPRQTKRFVLVGQERGIFIFNCGHRVTDNVFKDLVNCRTGVQVYQDTQLKLF
jgi:hypothetical protein